MKRIVAWVLTVMLLVSATAILTCANAVSDKESEEEGSMNKMHYGLHVESDGTLTLEGQPFYGFGLNYFGAFCHSFYSEADPPAYVSAFASIKEHNIPFVRLPLCGYYPDYYELFDADPEPIYAYMQSVLDTAAENQVGVIVSLMWWDPAIALHVNGKRSDMGVEGSDVLTYAQKYTEAIVSHFADHPAVWGWEIGNEYNLDADLCDANYRDFLWDMQYPGTERTDIDGYDYYTSTELAFFYAEIAKVIRKYDTYRMITTGNSEMRPAAYSLYSVSKKPNKKHLWNLNWNTDTQKKFNQINAIYTPDPIDTISFHLQHGTAGSATPGYVLELDRFRTKVSSLAYFQAYADAAKAQNKALFFGEFGDLLDMEGASDAIDTFRQITDWISEAGIQIAASWQFQDYTEEGINGQKLDVLSECNLSLQAAGKQEKAAAWAKHSPVTDETTADITADITDDVSATDTQASNSEQNGCGSLLAGSTMIAVTGATTVLLKRKKEKNAKNLK